MSGLTEIAPAFVEMAHRIVWCTVATVDTAGRPRTRILHPIWEWDGERLTGWIASNPQSLKGRHLARTSYASCTYWNPDHDTCSADCLAEWTNDPASKQALWDRFANAPAPVGYVPSIVPAWTSPDVEAFGVIRLTPYRLRVMPGSLMLQGTGQLLTWSEPAT